MQVVVLIVMLNVGGQSIRPYLLYRQLAGCILRPARQQGNGPHGPERRRQIDPPAYQGMGPEFGW